ncbi:rhomboid-like protein 11, chloroplastic isoform X1 [Punica granatum]|uniref:Rhomboid-like protein 11, chloroplastic isoform X1 n=2 Tax=Punica granatum TaxID=22663 RepID=A0A6P8C0B0_PUNGR|nr:rhomboid-like protein 11, chloroplastic isoform X1 [Punica granatum]
MASSQLLQLRQLAALRFRSDSAVAMFPSAFPIPPLQLKTLPFSSLSGPFNAAGPNKMPLPLTTRRPLLRFPCRLSGSGPDIISQLELGKPDEKPVKRVNGIFWIILLNLGIYVADHLFQVQGIKSLYLYHNWPAWYQFLTATFCHADWNHLSSNLFFLYIFGKLVEEEEGNFALWFCYIITGAGANLVSWLLLPRNSVSVGASGAVFGLFAISILVKMSWDWRKILEVLILGQFVIKRVMEAAQASTAMPASFRGNYSLQSINHVAHLSGALIGVLLVWLVSKVPSEPREQDKSISHRKTDGKF